MDRGQAHTLESIVAALLLLTSLIFVLQMTAVTPLSASTSSQHVENQLQASAEGVLSAAAHEGELKPTLLTWNADKGTFHDTSGKYYYTSKAPPTAFGDRLERAFGDRGIGYNVHVTYQVGSGGYQSDRVVYRGAPSDNAVQSAKTLVLTGSDSLHNATAHPTGVPLNDSNFYAPDIGSKGGAVYNVVRVEVIAWRI